MTLSACDKEETKVAEGPTKSVEINIANILTRSTGTAIADGTRVTLNDCQIFFTDGTALYKERTVTEQMPSTSSLATIYLQPQ